ncbi:uncharacterized protein LOC115218130 [Octopus sinensis]|uniref:Uncharacterized protein LOC115218130 n=1 Tax=Octopus sinensis TaxID=2607531 RepID=A0A7E6F7B0_9MOLL|nr:uncharacterized protein LOC115218130 [Octopus sinensis]
MNRIFILLSLLQIVYSSVGQSKTIILNSQLQPEPISKNYCWRIKFYISSKFLSGTSNYFTVQLINDETRVFSNKMSCANKCRRGSQPSFDFCTPRIDPVKELKLNETVKNIFREIVSAWTLESIYLMNLNTSATYRCTLDDPDADNKGCQLKPDDIVKERTIPYIPYGSTSNIITTTDDQTGSEENTSVLDYCWRIKFYISSKFFSGTSNYFTVQLINDETRVFSNKMSCANKCERGSQPSFDFCTPQIDPVKELKLNERVKNFFKAFTAGWRLETIYLMNLNTSATYRCTLDDPDADNKGCQLKPSDYCWRIKFYISSKLLSGTSNYFTVQLINDETSVFSNTLSCANKCERGSQPSFDFCTPQIDPVKELKLNEMEKYFFSGWTLESIYLMNLNTSATYRCSLDDPGAKIKGCQLKPEDIVKEPTIPYIPYGSTSNIITTTDDQTGSEENTSVLDYCWRITFHISNSFGAGTSNYITVQLINDETHVFSNTLSCADKCGMGSRPSFDFHTPQIDPVKELKLNETVKNIFREIVSAWTLESIHLKNLNTSATYKCKLDYPDADNKDCKLKPEAHVREPTIPYTYMTVPRT